MLQDPLIQPGECDLYIASPVEYEQCVVLVEHNQGLLFVLTDELLDGQGIVRFPSLKDGQTGWRIALTDLRAMLDRAEGRLLKGDK